MRVTNRSILLALAGVAAADSPIIGPVCPWNSSPRLRLPVCASPDFVRASIAPELLFGTKDGVRNLTWNQAGWQGPHRCINGTCLFSNDNIGGGIALITSEHHAKIVASFPQGPAEEAAPPPFHVAKVAGKGMGLVANRTIRKGEIIMQRTPTLLAQTAPIVDLDPTLRDLLYVLAVEALPDARQAAFMAQVGSDIHDKVNTNCFLVFVDGSSHLGCYPEVARMNHDCRPNAHYRISNMTHTTVAVRTIAPGEELSISYVDLLLTHAERRALLHKWGFECACAQCSQSAADTAASDARLRQIAKLKAELGDFSTTKVTAETGGEMVGLYEDEGLHTYLGNAYTRAALNFALFGEEERAREYAGMAVEALELEMGPGTGDARAMRILAEDPRKHWTWGKRRKHGK
ncbi:Uu.00g098670.m01.CDS01 [Anthostomella pinea]|uniref:Uu.00g098670.m01.CDS01 n=1 Tax=Anthostomella pinea TaxID=933095 RepID=A0AAI8YFA2_9PEZI|nr:Uu.00g098670.m01.CDS01 [Anthostomella pinea]